MTQMHTLGNAGKQFSRGFSGKSKAQYFFGHNMVFIDQFDNAVGHHTTSTRTVLLAQKENPAI